jgi:hypothetical protein
LADHTELFQVNEIKSPFLSTALEDLVQPYYVRFVLDTNEVMIADLSAAANFLDIKPMFDLTCLALALFLKVRSMGCKL